MLPAVLPLGPRARFNAGGSNTSTFVVQPSGVVQEPAPQAQGNGSAGVQQGRAGWVHLCGLQRCALIAQEGASKRYSCCAERTARTHPMPAHPPALAGPAAGASRVTHTFDFATEEGFLSYWAKLHYTVGGRALAVAGAVGECS